jgi:hypothetical protein
MGAVGAMQPANGWSASSARSRHFFSSARPKFFDANVNNNESQQTTNNRSYDSQPEKAPA